MGDTKDHPYRTASSYSGKILRFTNSRRNPPQITEILQQNEHEYVIARSVATKQSGDPLNPPSGRLLRSARNDMILVAVFMSSEALIGSFSAHAACCGAQPDPKGEIPGGSEQIRIGQLAFELWHADKSALGNVQLLGVRDRSLIEARLKDRPGVRGAREPAKQMQIAHVQLQAKLLFDLAYRGLLERLPPVHVSGGGGADAADCLWLRSIYPTVSAEMWGTLRE